MNKVAFTAVKTFRLSLNHNTIDNVKYLLTL